MILQHKCEEQRAFHNANQSKVLVTGTQTVQITVKATKDEEVKLLAVYRFEDIAGIMTAYDASKQDKVNFLKSIPQYQTKNPKELTKLAGFMRRSWCNEGDTVVSEGDAADAVYFVVSGQLSVSKAKVDGTRKIVNVLGAGTSFGQMGCVLDEGKRTATCIAITHCEVLVIHKYNFIRASDPATIDAMREKVAELARLSTNTEGIHQSDNSIAMTNFSTGRSGPPIAEPAVGDVGGAGPKKDISGFVPIKISQLKRATSVDDTKNTNPLLPQGPNRAGIPVSPDKTFAAVKPKLPDNVPPPPPASESESPAGGTPVKLQMVAEESPARSKDSVAVEASPAKDGPAWALFHTQQRPNTAGGEAAGRRRSPGRTRPATARDDAMRQQRRVAGRGRVTAAGLTVRVPGAPPLPSAPVGGGAAFCAWVGPRTAHSHGDHIVVGMAASPTGQNGGAVLMHRLTSARRPSASPRMARVTSASPRMAAVSVMSPQPPGSVSRRPATSRGGHITTRGFHLETSMASPKGGGDRPRPRTAPKQGSQSERLAPPGVFPWGVSPSSPRGKIIQHQRRREVPQGNPS